MLRSVLDALVFSGAWVALAAFALCAAAARAMEIAAPWPVLGLVFCGTLVIYAVDRLRDQERDHTTVPERSAFVARHERELVALLAAAGGLSVVCAWQVGWMPLVALAPAAGLGFFHRRTKRFAWVKASYITAAWLLVVVAFPAVAAAEARQPGWTALILGLGLQANAVASNVRDAEAAAGRLGPGLALTVARSLAALGILTAAFGPPETRALGLVPVSVAVALVGFRADERYGLFVVDGALLWGGLAAWWTAPLL